MVIFKSVACVGQALLLMPAELRVYALPSPQEGKRLHSSFSLRSQPMVTSFPQHDIKRAETVSVLVNDRQGPLGLRRRGCCLSKPDLNTILPLDALTLFEDDVSALPDQDEFYDDPNPIGGVDPAADDPTNSGLMDPADLLDNDDSIWLSDTGQQYAFQKLVQEGTLASGLDGAWQAAEVKGDSTRRTIDKYVTAQRDRLDDLGPLFRPKDMDDLYQTTARRHFNVDDDASRMLETFEMSGIHLDRTVQDGIYYEVNVTSKSTSGEDDTTSSPPGNILELFLNVHSGVMIVRRANAKNDRNTAADKLYSSELLWQTWRKYAVRSASDMRERPELAIANLKYVLRSDVVNQETENVMRIAHLLGGDNLEPTAVKPVDPDSVPTGLDGKKLGLDNGHGKWLPNNVMYNHLLSTPNIRTFAMLLADHNTELSNKYITEIHTFPRIHGGPNLPAREADWRQTSIVLVLGPKPKPRQSSSLPVSPSNTRTTLDTIDETVPGTIDTE